jgi:hypothetical protein
MKLEISSAEKNTIVYAITLWKNHIETGNITLSGKDAKQMLSASGKKKLSLYPNQGSVQVKPLGEDQRKLLSKLDAIKEKLEKL